MKVKTFWFNISSSCIDNGEHMKKTNMYEEYMALYTPEKIDKELNEFCENKDIVDIKVTEVCKQNTQNNGTNKVMLVYTVMYNENKED